MEFGRRCWLFPERAVQIERSQKLKRLFPRPEVLNKALEDGASERTGRPTVTSVKAHSGME